MSAIIELNRISKHFHISHEGNEKYKALRDVISNRAKKVFSFPKWMRPSAAGNKEEFWALRDISFSINPGERVGIIGRNGAGKSTLLKILSRITEPTSGSIRMKGRVASLLEVGTGFHPELSGRENIYLNGAILGMSRAEIRLKFDEIVAFAEIERFLDTPVKRYSSGMYVRLAFAVAAHLEPEILVIDEVLAVGDAQFQKKCLGKMEEVSSNDGRTVLFVSHNMGVVSQLCNRGILLSHGELKFSGDIKKVIDNYLRSDDIRNDYKVEDDSKKKNHIISIEITNANGEPCSDFSFEESMLMKFRFKVTEKLMGLQIGIGLEDKFNTRVFTIIKEIDFFQNNSEEYSGQVIFPSSLIAPNRYTFVMALWTKDGKVNDIVSNICPVTIIDNGTEHALYEGTDYGSI
ncbi:MAG: ABC transporter ATP-binding protein, partial [Sphingobacteriales bacterium]|nr:ABC transporter ATP-binding protein [Sphingobacteriales bacterium]